MKKTLRTIALVLALAMVFAMSTAFAEEALNGGEIGGYTEPDKQNVDDKVIKIAKEITVFNPDEAFVYGPAFTYTYTVTPGSSGVSITDATTDHATGLATTVTTYAGVTTGVSVNGGTAGDNQGASGTLEWTNADILDADTVANGGAANVKYFTINFTNVNFGAPGVYRYIITETPAANNEGYAAAGITETTGSRVRYLDVYVMRSAEFTELEAHGGTAGKTAYVAADWKVYGYVCIYDSEAITPDGDTTTTGAMKTNGFVAGTNDETAIPADQYHTYNLTIGKTLTGDPTMDGHKFPFDVAFSNASATGTFQFIAVTNNKAALTGTTESVAATATIAAHTKVGSASVVRADGKDGNPIIANGGTVKYIGIPTGTKVTVTETNDVTGTTYTTTATQDNTAVAFDDDASTAVLSADSKTATAAQGNTVGYVQATAPTADTNVAIQYTNTLAVISPTGLVLRFAPYALILAAGIALFVIFAVRRRKHAEEEE